MSYLTNDKSFNPHRFLFDFVVGNYHIGKSIQLKFKSTDGLKSIEKRLTVKFVQISEIVKVNQPPKWSDSTFKDFEDGGDLIYRAGDEVEINYKASDINKEDSVKITLIGKET